MKTEEQIKFYQEWGFSIKNIDGINFRRQGLKLSSFPPEEHITINQKLVRKLKRRSLVTSILMDEPRKDMYEFILATNSYAITDFYKKTRYNIKKSLKNCTFQRPSLEVLIEDGLKINLQSLEKQHRKEKLLTDRRQWTNYMTSVYNSSEFNILGAFYEGRMVGILIAYEAEGKFNILKAFIDRTNSTLTQPMTGLLYSMINNLISKNGAIAISYGMHQFKGKSSLNDFKRRLYFEPYTATRGYILNPLLSFPLKLLVFYMIKIRKVHSPGHKWEKEVIRIFQGYRQVKAVLKREKETLKAPSSNGVYYEKDSRSEAVRLTA